MFFSVANHVWARQSSQPHREEQQSWRAIVGNKALGLTALPTAWTPPFLVVGTSLYAEWLRSGPAGRATVLAPTAKALASYMAQHPEWAERGLIIRSSAVRESMKDRGAYQSLELSADFDDHVIVRKITEIFGAFYSSGVNDEIALIVQSRAHTTLKGHLSNERRVTATSNHWMWEIEPPNDAEGRVNSQRESIPDADKPLLCKPGDRDALVELFRRIGRFCTEMNRGRVHLEWGYADQTLWLFQLDFEEGQRTPSKFGNLRLERRREPNAPHSHSVGQSHANNVVLCCASGSWRRPQRAVVHDGA